MTNELNALEGKIAQVVSLCHALRSENFDLQRRIAALEAEKLQLVDRMNGARTRLESLVEQLPEAKG